MEVFHESSGVTFIDDFAHHPTAVRETIAAARMRWPGRRLWVLFEPRSNTTVTRRFQGEMTDAFGNADIVWLGPLHRAESIPLPERLDREELARDLTGRGVHASCADDVSAIVEALSSGVTPGDVVLILSNGAFGGIYARIREVFA
jgi:UDP-N-acetylmuramate: L-alanyl-gamma-D-glutamyl-meso-diaminopimelate ligase